MKAIHDLDDPRLVKALAHPLRVRIMGVLEQRSATPKQLAETLGVGLENLAYHVRTLRDMGLIKLERREQVRGAIAHHYRAVARPRVSARAWQDMPEVSKHAMLGAALQQISGVVNVAAAEGRFTRPDSHLSRRPLVLDDDGFAQASALLSQALDDLSSLEREASKRIRRGSGEVHSTAVVMLFETPDQVPAGSDGQSGKLVRQRRDQAASGARTR